MQGTSTAQLTCVAVAGERPPFPGARGPQVTKGLDVSRLTLLTLVIFIFISAHGEFCNY